MNAFDKHGKPDPLVIADLQARVADLESRLANREDAQQDEGGTFNTISGCLMLACVAATIVTTLAAFITRGDAPGWLLPAIGVNIVLALLSIILFAGPRSAAAPSSTTNPPAFGASARELEELREGVSTAPSRDLPPVAGDPPAVERSAAGELVAEERP